MRDGKVFIAAKVTTSSLTLCNSNLDSTDVVISLAVKPVCTVSERVCVYVCVCMCASVCVCVYALSSVLLLF